MKVTADYIQQFEKAFIGNARRYVFECLEDCYYFYAMDGKVIYRKKEDYKKGEDKIEGIFNFNQYSNKIDTVLDLKDKSISNDPVVLNASKNLFEDKTIFEFCLSGTELKKAIKSVCLVFTGREKNKNQFVSLAFDKNKLDVIAYINIDNDILHRAYRVGEVPLFGSNEKTYCIGVRKIQILPILVPFSNLILKINEKSQFLIDGDNLSMCCVCVKIEPDVIEKIQGYTNLKDYKYTYIKPKLESS